MLAAYHRHNTIEIHTWCTGADLGTGLCYILSSFLWPSVGDIISRYLIWVYGVLATARPTTQNRELKPQQIAPAMFNIAPYYIDNYTKLGLCLADTLCQQVLQ